MIASAQDDGWQQVNFNYLPDLKRNRSVAVFDIPQNRQMAFVYELPFGTGKKYATSGMAKKIAGDLASQRGIFRAFRHAVYGDRFRHDAQRSRQHQTADQVKPIVARLGNVGPGQNFLRSHGVCAGESAPFRDKRVEHFAHAKLDQHGSECASPVSPSGAV